MVKFGVSSGPTPLFFFVLIQAEQALCLMDQDMRKAFSSNLGKKVSVVFKNANTTSVLEEVCVNY